MKRWKLGNTIYHYSIKEIKCKIGKILSDLYTSFSKEIKVSYIIKIYSDKEEILFSPNDDFAQRYNLN